MWFLREVPHVPLVNVPNHTEIIAPHFSYLSSMLFISTPAQSIEEKKQRLLALAKRKREEVAATAKSRLGRTWQ
jgi:hypothetical protein